MITADQLIAHAVGDYIIQSDWMASEKTKKSLAAGVHAVTYALPFLFLTLTPVALAFIAVTHFIIDRWRLARYICWVKNWVGLKTLCIICDHDGAEHKEHYLPVNRPWKECKATGYDPTKPPWMTVWLMIIVDNIMHVLLNGVALAWLA